MHKKRIAVLGANLPLLNFYKRAKKLGFEIHAFAWEDGAVCKPIADFFYPISFTNVDEIVKVCQEKNIQGVTSFSLESALPFVYEICKKMGWQVPSQKCQFLSLNKLTMRNAFLQNEVSVPHFIETKDRGVAIDFFPVIVKPIDSGGSRGVTKVDDQTTLTAAIDRAKAYSPSNQVLVEQFIDGEEYSVEAMSYNGVHHIVAITEKVTTGSPFFVELAHFQPADLTPQRTAVVKRLTIEALNALDYMEGPSHTEVKFDQSGLCYVIEVGLRLGGDFITSDLVRLSSGYDMVQASVELACGNFVAPSLNKGNFSGVYFKAPQTSKLWERIEEFTQSDFCVEAESWSNLSGDISESADRQGYFIYQNTERLKLNGTF
jgi:biotin carboxylase